MTTVLIDSNVLLRHLLGDHPDQSQRATNALAQIERGDLRGMLTVTVIFETVFTLERSYKREKAVISEALHAILEVPVMVIEERQRVLEALNFYADLNLPFADAYHAAVTLDEGLDAVLSFDRHFDRIPGIRRLEP